MARPKKSGIDYFPLDTDLPESDFVFLLEESCGIESFGILCKILCKIYKEEGYYMIWDDKKISIFARKSGVSGEKLRAIAKVGQDEGFFDKGMYEKFTILTSRGIQKRYIEATRKRESPFIIPQFDLMKNNVSSGNPAEETTKEEEGTSKNSLEMPQSIVKEIITKETKLNNTPQTPQSGGPVVKKLSFQTRIFLDLANWFKTMDDVDSPYGLSQKYLTKYSPEKIGKILKDTACTSRANFNALLEK